MFILKICVNTHMGWIMESEALDCAIVVIMCTNKVQTAKVRKTHAWHQSIH